MTRRIVWVDCSCGTLNEQERVNTRNRLQWTGKLEMKFLEAINKIGVENATPTAIMKEMGISDLTRTQISSHLQKYKKKLQQKKLSVGYLIN